MKIDGAKGGLSIKKWARKGMGGKERGTVHRGKGGGWYNNGK
jgi:hypothetical protein